MEIQKVIEEVRINMSTISLNAETQKRVVEAKEMAMMALEKQLPKKVIFDGLYKCPHCKESMLQGCMQPKSDYHEKCGGRLDWNI